MTPMGVGVIGAGNISDAYLTNLTAFPDLEVRWIADLLPDRARDQAARYRVPRWGDPDALLADPRTELVVNLTVPAGHAAVGQAAVSAGKHVWQEKPLALNPADGRRLLDAAAERGVRVACAPDTLLGAGLQTARRAVAAGRIGRPMTALAIAQYPGPDVWHPNPEFLFQDGAGPLFDIGPYYLTTLVELFGPVRRVTAAGGRARERRVIGAGPRAGTEFDVTVPTTVTALVEFRSGGSAQLLLSFDSGLSRSGLMEVTGTAGTAVLPDPNRFDGVTVIHPLRGESVTLEPVGHTATRGTGVVDLARAIRSGEPERAGGELAWHILAVMTAIIDSIDNGEPVEPAGTATIPPPLPPDWDPFVAAR